MNRSMHYINNSMPFGKNKIQQNAPAEYCSRQKQYLADRTRTFTDQRAYLSSDYMQAEAQGLTDDFYEWQPCMVRLSDVSTLNVTSLSAKKSDDFKEVFFTSKHIDYFPIGAKLQTMGSTWISINPNNISSVNATSIVARCNASYNVYDYYGNIVTEPIIIDRNNMIGNAPENPQNMVLMDGSFAVHAQLNDITKQLGENKRIILGKKAYIISGYTDFLQEFSGNYESTHYLTFTLRVTEPNKNDDIENRIAEGLNYTFNAEINGADKVTVGNQITLDVQFLKNGIETESTEQYPINWEFTSSDENIATVNENGVVTGIGVGQCEITAVLRENPNVTVTKVITVAESQNVPYVAFSDANSKKVTQYTKEAFTAQYYDENGETNLPLEWEFFKADSNNYKAVVSDDGLSVTVECINPDNKPLVIRAKRNGYYSDIQIALIGY